ncbi:MAG: hypothetical protein AAB289_10310, partial [Chloroflexota bacterium]
MKLDVVGDIQGSGMVTTPFGGLGPYQNLLVRSEEFEHSAWTKPYTVTAGTLTAPDGTDTAELLPAGLAGDNTAQTISGQVTASKTFIGSLWLQAPSGTAAVSLRLDSGNETGTAAVTATTTWQRFSVAKTFTSGSTPNLTFRIINGTVGVRAWGAQVEEVPSSVTLPGIYARTIDDTVAAASRDTGFALGKNAHITGNLEVHGSIITHTGSGGNPGDVNTGGNLVWKSGTGNAMTFDHDLTGPRTLKFSEVATNSYVATLPNAGLTNGGVVFGNGTGLLSDSGLLTNGQLLIGDGAGAPTAAPLTGTANEITVANGPGSITLGIPDDGLNFTELNDSLSLDATTTINAPSAMNLTLGPDVTLRLSSNSLQSASAVANQTISLTNPDA